MLKEKDLEELLYYIEIGLATGRPWISVFEELSHQADRGRIQRFTSLFLKISSQVGQERCLLDYKNKSKSIEEAMFFEILILSEQSSAQFRQSLKQFRDLIYQVGILKKKKKSLFLTSKFQAMSAILVSLFLSLGVPTLFPEWSPSFLDLDRPDLYFAGWLMLFMGIGVLSWLSYWPIRNQKQELSFIMFLNLNSLFLRAGQSLRNSWKKSLNAVSFSKKWRRHLVRAEIEGLMFEDYLLNIGRHLPKPCPDFTRGLSWVLRAGSSLHEYFQESSLVFRENFLYEWEEGLKKSSLVALLPLYFICLPASLFLSMGPWVWEFVS